MMNSNEIEKIIEEIFSLYQEFGEEDYIGEAISQRAHALQTAALASKLYPIKEVPEDASSPVEAVPIHIFVVSCLFHDIGHLVAERPQLLSPAEMAPSPSFESMDRCGAAGHENIGGTYLQQRGFSPTLIQLVRGHVDAKRYLCTTRDGFQQQLSPASQVTLTHQGGPMKPEEVEAFEKDPLFRWFLLLRQCDDGAKVPDLVVPEITHYHSFISQCFV